jgi:hypothetical protein
MEAERNSQHSRTRSWDEQVSDEALEEEQKLFSAESLKTPPSPRKRGSEIRSSGGHTSSAGAAGSREVPSPKPVTSREVPSPKGPDTGRYIPPPSTKG